MRQGVKDWGIPKNLASPLSGPPLPSTNVDMATGAGKYAALSPFLVAKPLSNRGRRNQYYMFRNIIPVKQAKVFHQAELKVTLHEVASLGLSGRRKKYLGSWSAGRGHYKAVISC